MRRTPWILLHLLFAVVLIFHLGHYSLWQDEADQALLSVAITETGVPRALLGEKLITQYHARESTSDYLWFYNPWLPLYLEAASFKLFGVGPWQARLPFVLIGILTLIPLGFLAQQWTHEKNLTWLSLFFFVTNPWIILYTRQAKYYSIVFLASALIYLAIKRGESGKKYGLLFFSGFLILFHSIYLTAAFLVMGLLLYVFLDEAWKGKRAGFIKILCFCLAFCLPFFLLGSFETRLGLFGHLPDLATYFKKFFNHLYYVNRQVFPIALWIPLLLWRGELKFSLCLILTSWFLLPLIGFDVFRYNLHLVPIYMLLTAQSLLQVYRRKKGLGILAGVLIWGTNLVQALPDFIWKAIQGKPQSQYLLIKEEWLAMKNYYLEEFPDPIVELPKILEKRWRPGERIYMNYATPSWLFHTHFPLAYQVEAVKAPAKDPPLAPEWTSPEFIDWWVGPHPIKLIGGPYLSAEEMISTWQAKGFDYEKIETTIPISHWDLNSPIRMGQFLDKFLRRGPQETIFFLHRIPKKPN